MTTECWRECNVTELHSPFAVVSLESDWVVLFTTFRWFSFDELSTLTLSCTYTHKHTYQNQNVTVLWPRQYTPRPRPRARTRVRDWGWGVAPSSSAVTPLNETAPHEHGCHELCTLSSAQPLDVKLFCAAHANAVVFSADFVHLLTVFYF